MELNYRKEKLQNEVDIIQEQIYFLANLRESQKSTEDCEEKIKLEVKALFDQMLG
jgi:hypothetical protein